LALSLGACSRDTSWHLNNVRGIVPALQFSGQVAGPKPINAESLRGQIVLVYFGYTHCPDACPTTLARLMAVLHDLPAAGTPVRVLFISVDPNRDTPDVLARYASAFGPQVTGVHVDASALEDLAKRYRISYSRDPADAKGNYEVTHSSAVFIFDASGRARLLGTDTQSVADYVADLTRLRKEPAQNSSS
jgi:protein SCO1/2